MTPEQGTAPAGGEGYREGLRALLVQMAPPYGFTLATFTAGGITAHFHDGSPNPWEILFFLFGAFVGYMLLAAGTASLTHRLRPRPIPLNSWQMVHVVPLAVVFLLALASASLVTGPLAWFTSGVALTLGYLGSLAFVIRFLRRRDDAMLGSS